MSYYAIGDLHFSGNPQKKPMDKFGPHWERHDERILADWKSRITEEDTIFIVGDTSWAMRLDEVKEDLDRIIAMPGKKVIIRGNHDYWWASKAKMNVLTEGSLVFLQGDACNDGTVSYGGTRGYLCPGDSAFKEETDRSIYERELLRTRAALEKMTGDIRILLLHYPPFNDKNEPSGFTELLEEFKVDHCIYGHLHDSASHERIPSTFGNTKLHLVSMDAVQFQLYLLHL